MRVEDFYYNAVNRAAKLLYQPIQFGFSDCLLQNFGPLPQFASD